MISSNISDKDYKKILAKAYKKTLEVLALPDDFEAGFDFLTAGEMRSLNLEKRGLDKVTDVLSFPYTIFKFPYKKSDYAADLNPETDRIMLGDVVICKEKMSEQAREFEHSASEEFRFLVTHGLLHLFGFDHGTEDDRRKMREIEKKTSGEI